VGIGRVYARRVDEFVIVGGRAVKRSAQCVGLDQCTSAEEFKCNSDAVAGAIARTELSVGAEAAVLLCTGPQNVDSVDSFFLFLLSLSRRVREQHVVVLILIGRRLRLI
jgi:hypothetical protein